MSKRTKFALVSLLLAVGLGFVSFVPVDSRLILYIVASVLAYVLSAWVIFEDLRGVEWISLLILPVMFILGAGLFSYYLPVLVPSLVGFEFDLNMARTMALAIRLLYFVLIGLGFYAILLTENIFSVASVRSIALLRAARSVGFVMILLTGLFFFHTILSLKIAFWGIGLLVFAVSCLFNFAGLWSVDLKAENIKEKVKLSALAAFLMSQMGMALSFWPVSAFLGALMLVSGLYVVLGLFQQRLTNRIFLGSFLEYVVFSAVVIVVAFFITSWRN